MSVRVQIEDTCFCIIREALHLHEIYRKVAQLVPYVQHNVDLAKEIALREAFEVKMAILVLAYVYFIFPTS